ncbi:MAG: RNA-binding protein [Cytophagales bacterium]|nr:RNA-binding protein [Cytophagales bacterium]
MNLYVGNLHYCLGEEELFELFSQFGMVKSLRLVKDNKTRKSRGYAFVEMDNEFAGEIAIRRLNNKIIEGRNVIVLKAKTKAVQKPKHYEIRLRQSTYEKMMG